MQYAPSYGAGPNKASTHIYSTAIERYSRNTGWMVIASSGDCQTHHSHHPGHQRNSVSVSTPVHSSAAGECGLLPQHNEHRIRSRRSRCLTFCLVFTPAALCWWAKNNNNNNNSCTRISIGNKWLEISNRKSFKYSTLVISHWRRGRYMPIVICKRYLFSR